MGLLRARTRWLAAAVALLGCTSCASDSKPPRAAVNASTTTTSPRPPATAPPITYFAPVGTVLGDRTYPLWPEPTPAAARASARTGPQWRRDIDETAVRFARTVLRWQDATVASEVDISGAAGRRVTNGTSTVVVSLNPWAADWWSVSGVQTDGKSFGVSVSGRRFQIGIRDLGQQSGTLTVMYGDRSVDKELGRGEQQVVVNLPFNPDTPGNALVLLRNDRGTVIAAYTAGLPAGNFAAG